VAGRGEMFTWFLVDSETVNWLVAWRRPCADERVIDRTPAAAAAGIIIPLC